MIRSANSSLEFHGCKGGWGRKEGCANKSKILFFFFTMPVDETHAFTAREVIGNGHVLGRHSASWRFCSATRCLPAGGKVCAFEPRIQHVAETSGRSLEEEREREEGRTLSSKPLPSTILTRWILIFRRDGIKFIYRDAFQTAAIKIFRKSFSRWKKGGMWVKRYKTPWYCAISSKVRGKRRRDGIAIKTEN